MAENENKESQETTNEVSAPEDLEAIKAQLEEEKKAKAAAEASLAEKDARIVELQAEGEALRAERSNLLASLSEAKLEVDTQANQLQADEDQLTTLKEAHGQAVAKYLDAVRLANPAIPRDIIAGDTIEEIDASLAKATTIAESVRASLEAQAKEARVPPGAPPRTEISVEGLSPREKIAAGIQQKGGA